MPLSSAQAGLEAQIKSAFLAVLEAGKQDGANPETIVAQLASGLSEAIHAYTTQAQVNTTITVTPGIAVATAGSPSAQAGSTTSPGSGTGTGNLT
tara:strand:- start:210 stop:494 length:285 start_codon:yes stop_codon:yes gene_type:complete